MTASRMAGATPAALSLAKFMHVLLAGGVAPSLAGLGLQGLPCRQTIAAPRFGAIACRPDCRQSNRRGRFHTYPERAGGSRVKNSAKARFCCDAALNPWQDFVITVRTVTLSQFG